MTELYIMYLVIGCLGTVQFIFIVRNALYQIRMKNTLADLIIEYKKTERQAETNSKNIEIISDVVSNPSLGLKKEMKDE